MHGLIIVTDQLKSTLHRVTLPPLADRYEGAQRLTRERYSIPYFVAPDPEAMVQCLPGCPDEGRPPKYDPVTQRLLCHERESAVSEVKLRCSGIRDDFM